MKKLARLMLLGVPVIAFSTAALSADEHTGGLIFKSKYKKTVSTSIDGQSGDCLKLMNGNTCHVGDAATKESTTYSIKDSTTGKLLYKFRLISSGNGLNNFKIEDLSPKSPDAPVVSTEAGDTRVDSSGNTVEQPTVVLSDPSPSSPTTDSSTPPAAAEAPSSTTPAN